MWAGAGAGAQALPAALARTGQRRFLPWTAGLGVRVHFTGPCGQCAQGQAEIVCAQLTETVLASLSTGRAGRKPEASTSACSSKCSGKKVPTEHESGWPGDSLGASYREVPGRPPLAGTAAPRWQA